MHADRLHAIAAQFALALSNARADGLHVEVNVRSQEVATIGENSYYHRSPIGLGVHVALPLPPTPVNRELAMKAMSADWSPESPSRR